MMIKMCFLVVVGLLLNLSHVWSSTCVNDSQCSAGYICTSPVDGSSAASNLAVGKPVVNFYCQISGNNCSNGGKVCASNETCKYSTWSGVGRCVVKNCYEDSSVCPTGQTCVDRAFNTKCNIGQSCVASPVCMPNNCLNGGVTCTAAQKCSSNGQCIDKPCNEIGANACPSGTVCRGNDGSLCPAGFPCANASCQAPTCTNGGVTCSDQQKCVNGMCQSSLPCNVAGGDVCTAGNICINQATGGVCAVGQSCYNPTCKPVTCANGGADCPSGQKCQGDVNGVFSCVAKSCVESGGVTCPGTAVCQTNAAAGGVKLNTSCKWKTCANGGLKCPSGQFCTNPTSGFTCAENDANCANTAVCQIQNCGTACGVTQMCKLFVGTGSSACISKSCASGGAACGAGQVCVDPLSGGTCAATQACATSSINSKMAICAPASCANGGVMCPSGQVCSDSDGMNCSVNKVCAIPTMNATGTLVVKASCKQSSCMNDPTKACPSGQVCSDPTIGVLCKAGQPCAINSTAVCKPANWINGGAPCDAANPVQQSDGSCAPRTCANGGDGCIAGFICADSTTGKECAMNDLTCARKAVCKKATCANGGVAVPGGIPIRCKVGEQCTDPVTDKVCAGSLCDNAYCKTQTCANGGPVCSNSLMSSDGKNPMSLICTNLVTGSFCAVSDVKCANNAMCQPSSCMNDVSKACGTDKVCSDPKTGLRCLAGQSCATLGTAICVAKTCINDETKACAVGMLCANRNNEKCKAGDACALDASATCVTLNCANGGTSCSTGQQCASSAGVPCVADKVCEMPSCVALALMNNNPSSSNAQQQANAMQMINDMKAQLSYQSKGVAEELTAKVTKLLSEQAAAQAAQRGTALSPAELSMQTAMRLEQLANQLLSASHDDKKRHHHTEK